MGLPLDAPRFADHSTEGPASGQLLRVNARPQLEDHFDGPNRKQGVATSRGGRIPGVGRQAVMREINRLLWLQPPRDEQIITQRKLKHMEQHALPRCHFGAPRGHLAAGGSSRLL